MEVLEVLRLLFGPQWLGCPTYQDVNIAHFLPDLLRPGPAVSGALWRLGTMAASWAVASFLVFLFRTVLAMKRPKKYQVNLLRTNKKINSFMKTNRELSKSISLLEQKITESKISRRDTTRHNRMLSGEALKFKPGGLKTRSELGMQRTVMTEDCSLEESEKKAQAHHAASGCLKVGKEASLHRREKKVRFLDEICGEGSLGTQGKVDMNRCELVEKKQLLAAEERAKLAEKETRMYKRRLEELQQKMQEAEDAFRHQITLAERKAADNWLRAHGLEMEKAQMRRREVAHLKQRLDVACGQRQAGECVRQAPTPGGPHRLPPPLRGSGPGAAPVRSGGFFPDEAEDTQVRVAGRAPRPIPAAAYVLYPRRCPPPFVGCVSPPPGPPWWPWDLNRHLHLHSVDSRCEL
ncbi:transport and Golgi organization protein 1 homolog isoform X2 [Vicugna pacos]|uniref:Transport and Golgi organization protein 1 homolog isoform X2 n=1 Tax=Vicugna pacos TaxID=30538 RepID=A0ABM5C7B2_VICPA